MAYSNEGQEPFIFTPTEDMKPKEIKEKARKANKTYYKLKGLKRKRKPPCPECGRRINCKHRVAEYETPKLLLEWITRTNCQATVRGDTSYCPECYVYDPGKPRAHPQVEPKKPKEEAVKKEKKPKKEKKQKKEKKEKI